MNKQNLSEHRTLRYTAVATMAAIMLFLAAAGAANAAADGAAPPVTLETVPGSDVPRITLNAKAAERLGIETAVVSESVVPRTQVVGGVATPSMDSQLRPIRTEFWVHVTVSAAELARLARDKPAHLLPLVVGSPFSNEVPVQPTGLEPLLDESTSMYSLYYLVPEDIGLRTKDRVRVELPVAGSDEPEKVVPYSAVYYDSSGSAWVYVTDQALVFQRQPIVIDRVVGDLAVLSDGPPPGTTVVSVGSALLYGTEIFGK